MPRSARIVVPGVAHHVIQRGNRRQDVFFSDDDKEFYLTLLYKWSHIGGVSILAYCLMNNHVHLVGVPRSAGSLALTFGETHKRYAQVVNARRGWTGHLWQARFSSYPLDDPYRFRAIRYAEMNPVRAKLVGRAEEYPWSSAGPRVREEQNAFLGRNPLGMTGPEWAAYLAEGLVEAETELFREHANTSLPLGDEGFMKKIGMAAAGAMR